MSCRHPDGVLGLNSQSAAGRNGRLSRRKMRTQCTAERISKSSSRRSLVNCKRRCRSTRGTPTAQKARAQTDRNAAANRTRPSLNQGRAMRAAARVREPDHRSSARVSSHESRFGWRGCVLTIDIAPPQRNDTCVPQVRILRAESLIRWPYEATPSLSIGSPRTERFKGAINSQRILSIFSDTVTGPFRCSIKHLVYFSALSTSALPPVQTIVRSSRRSMSAPDTRAIFCFVLPPLPACRE